MKVYLPLPNEGFDPTEAAVTWKILCEHDHSVIISTPTGQMPEADPRMLTGRGLGPLKGILAADANACAAYSEMMASKEFRSPMRWNDLSAQDADGLVLAGGHAPGMKEYLESSVLQELVVEMIENKPVGAICHGVVLAARSINSDGKSVLWNRRTTALLKRQELLAWSLTRLWLKDYYRTYPETVEDEVRAVLASPEQFVAGPAPLFRDSPENLKPGFVVVDKNYVSARWPGDAHRFATEFCKIL